MPFDAFCRGDSLVRTVGRCRHSSLPPALISLLQALQSPTLHQSRAHYMNVNHKPLCAGINHTSPVWNHVEPFALHRVVHYKYPPEMEIEYGHLASLIVPKKWGRVVADLGYC